MFECRVCKWYFYHISCQAIIVSCCGCFHGRTLAAISMSCDNEATRGFWPLLTGHLKVDFGDDSALEKIFKGVQSLVMQYLQKRIYIYIINELSCVLVDSMYIYIYIYICFEFTRTLKNAELTIIFYDIFFLFDQKRGIKLLAFCLSLFKERLGYVFFQDWTDHFGCHEWILSLVS